MTIQNRFLEVELLSQGVYADDWKERPECPAKNLYDWYTLH